jgi:phospholipid/cholesterol/gamma-HCH transport system permease protein
MTAQQEDHSALAFERADNATLQILLTGSWCLRDGLPSIEPVLDTLENDRALKRISFSSKGIRRWDSGLLVFLSKLDRYSKENDLQLVTDGLPTGIRKLLDLAAASVETRDRTRHIDRANLLGRIGDKTLDWVDAVPQALHFIGESLKSIGRLVSGRAQYNSADALFITQQVGPQALPIVSLISFLVGLILAYMGALQLERFGAQIYVADLVGIAMVREVGALMTAIIMAGRTGAAYAAELGTMQVNEEIDAYRTLGISPMDYLVMPRLLALVLMMPLLSLYAGLVGIAAGIVISVTVFDLSAYEYYQQTVRALNVTHFAVGMMKGTLYGVLIALAGCLRGMQCGRSAQAVGQATTSAVVTCIVSIVVAASLTTIILQRLGI